VSDKLRSALEWYALPGTYAIPTKEWPDARLVPAYWDGGRRAREALAGSVEPVDGNLRERQAFVDGFCHRIAIDGQVGCDNERRAMEEADRRYGKGQNDA
jgi:hypothetical protein